MYPKDRSKRGLFSLKEMGARIIMMEEKAMKIDIEHQNREQSIVYVTGDVTDLSAIKFKDTLYKLIDRGRVKLVIEFTKVPLIDSNGLGALINILKRTKTKGGDIYLVGLSQSIKDVFVSSGLDKIFPIFPSVKDIKTQYP